MNDVVVGINEQKLDQLVLDIIDASTRIKSKLDKIEMLVDETSTFYNCSAADNYRSKFNDFKSNFSIVNKNFIDMSNDLLNVKLSKRLVEEDVKDNFRAAKFGVDLSSSEEEK